MKLHSLQKATIITYPNIRNLYYRVFIKFILAHNNKISLKYTNTQVHTCIIILL